MAFDPDAYLAEAPASESSIKSKFDPDAFVADTVDEHKIDPNFNPLATALAAGEGTPEWEHARKVDEAREAMSSSDKKKYGLEDSFGGKAVNAVKGAVQFGVGLAAAPALNAASIAANTPSIIKGTSNALLGTNFDDTRSPVAQQLQTDAVLAAEKAGQSVQPEQGSTPTKSYLISRTMDHPLTAQEIADLKAGKLKKEIEQLPNQSFKDKVEDFRRNSELSQGKVQDVGIFADVAKKSGFIPSEATLTPEQKKELGVEPDAVENYIIDAAGTAENPENAVYALAPEIPGVAGALKGTGKAISAVASPLAKAAELLPEGSLHSLVAHPVRTALASTLRGGLKLAPKAGEFVQSAGEMAGGAAPAEGASALGIRAKQALIGSVGGTVIGAATDPEDPVQGALSGFVMGAGGGALHSAKGAQLAGKRAAMEEQGAALRTGNDAVDAKHDIIVGNFDPEAAKAINRQRAALAADGTHLVVTDQAGFNAAMQANGMPDANGVRGATLGDDKHIVTQGQDGSRTIYINADAVGGEKGFQGVDTAGHEIGHAVVDYLKAQSSQAAASTLVDAVANSLTDAEKADIAAKYSKAINAQTAGASVNPTEETIAEITRKVLAKQDISEFGMPKTLGTKISNAISDFFTGARGDSAGMLWGTPEITKAKRLIQDALYDQGKRSTEMRQRARDVVEGKIEPNVTERQQQITARLEEIAALDPKKVTPSILKERGQLVREASDLTADEAARTGQPAPGATPAPAQPAAPAGPSANDRLTVKTALVTMGYPARVADQMAAAAQGGTIEELIKDALAKKQPTPVPQTAPPAAPAPNVAPSGIPPAVLQPKPVAATPTGQLSTFEAPAATATAEAPAQLSTFDPNATNQVSAGVPPLSPGNVNGGPTPTEPAGGSRPVSTPEEVGAAVGAATDAAKATPEYERALKKKEKAKAAGDAATEAQADARLETLEREARLDALKKLLPRHEEGSGTAPDELHVSADNFGNESVRGKVDESNPVHREIMAHGEMSPEEIARVKQLQESAGTISYIDYGSAEKEDNVRRHGEQRRAELAASPAQERVEGVGGITEQKNKAVIPVGNTVTASGRVNTVALSPDKILSNLGSVVRAATENSLPNGGFSGRPEALQNLSIYLRNHRNGFSGDGTVKVDPTIAPNATGESFVDANGQPVDPETAKARMRVFNVAMHDTRATAPARAEAKRSAYEAAMKAWTDGGEQGPKPRKPRDLDPKSKFQAEEGQALAKRFGEMDEATGETNPLRADLEAAGYDANKELESPWENLRPELIRDIRDSADGKQEIVRPHRVAPEDIEGAVTSPPSGKATLAGFMPGEGEPSIKSKGGDLTDFKPKQDELGFYSRLRSHVDEAALGTSKPKPAQQWLGVIDKWAKGASTPTLGVEGRGIAKEELELSGIREWLQDHGGKPLSKAEVLDFIDKGGVQVKEVAMGTRDVDPVFDFDSDGYEFRTEDEDGEPFENGGDVYKDGERVGSAYDYNEAQEVAKADFINRYGAEKEDNTKFGQWRLEGGENYKEIMLTVPPQGGSDMTPNEMAHKLFSKDFYDLPKEDAQQVLNELRKGRKFTDTHQAPPAHRYGDYSNGNPDINRVAHFRQADFTDTEGSDLRLIEEIQSDLHQQGRKEGYKSSEMKKAVLRANGSFERWADAEDLDPVAMKTLKRMGFTIEDRPFEKGKVPNLPFKKNWSELAFKRALRMAVEDGKDKIAWTTGQTQNDRYSLSNAVDRLDATRFDYGNGEPKYNIEGWKDGEQVASHQVKESELASVVGDEMAEKIIRTKSPSPEEVEAQRQKVTEAQNAMTSFPDTEGWTAQRTEDMSGGEESYANLWYVKDAKGNVQGIVDETVPTAEAAVAIAGQRVANTEGKHLEKAYRDEQAKLNEMRDGIVSFKGVDLEIGGDGMKGFYDKILPDFVRKYVAKWGGKVETTELAPGKNGGEWNGQQRPYIKEGASGVTVHSVTITPEMRDAVMGGQPMFMPGGSEGQSNLTADVEKNIRDAKMMAPKDPAGFLRKMADSARTQGKEDAAVNFEKAITALGKPGGDLSDFKPEDRSAEPSIKSKGDLANFMPGDFSGRNEVNVKDRSEDTDFSPEAMKKRRIGDFMAQKPWLDEQAQKLGYDDSDALNDADNAKFNELASQWREDHPRFDRQGRQLFMPGEGKIEVQHWSEDAEDYDPWEIADKAEKVFRNAGLRPYRDSDLSLVAFGKDGEPIGATYKRLEDADAEELGGPEGETVRVYKFDIGVDPKAQGGTVGYMLTKKAIQDARSDGADVMKNWVINEKMAEMLEKFFGFEYDESPSHRDGFSANMTLWLDGRQKGRTDLPKFMPGEVEEKNLVAVHNLSIDNLRHALKVGGLAVPSLAIIRADKTPFDSFGDITLVANPETIDPKKNSTAKTFNADVYSPRYPKVNTFFKEKDAKTLNKFFEDYRDEAKGVETGKWSWNPKNIIEKIQDRGVGEVQYSDLAMYSFLRDKGLIEPAADMSEKELSEKVYTEGKKHRDEIGAWMQGKMRELGIDPIEKIFKGYTNSGNRSYAPHDLDTVVKIMKKELRNGEGFNYGVPSIRSKVAKQFRSLKAIQDARGDIITKPQMEALKEEIDKEFQALQTEAMKSRDNDGGSHRFDAFADDLIAMAEGGSENWRHLREMYPDGIPDGMREFLDKLKHLPTEYFETKIQRAVDLHEFAGAAVPDDAPEDVIKSLKKRGLSVETYKDSDPASRQAAVNKLAVESRANFMPGDEPRRTWFVRDGKRVYHQRRGDGTFAPKQTLAKPPMGALTSANPDDDKQLADFK